MHGEFARCLDIVEAKINGKLEHRLSTNGYRAAFDPSSEVALRETRHGTRNQDKRE